MGGRARRAWKAPSRECHLSKRRLAGSSGRKVTVRLKSARRKSGLQGAEGLARMGGEWWGAPHCHGPWERLSPRGGQRGQAQDPEPVPGRRAGTLYCKEAVA